MEVEVEKPVVVDENKVRESHRLLSGACFDISKFILLGSNPEEAKMRALEKISDALHLLQESDVSKTQSESVDDKDGVERPF